LKAGGLVFLLLLIVFGTAWLFRYGAPGNPAYFLVPAILIFLLAVAVVASVEENG